MDKRNVIRRISLFILALSLLSSCISMPTIKETAIPNQRFIPSNEESLIFGRLEIFVNGQAQPADTATTYMLDMNSLPPVPSQWSKVDLMKARYWRISNIRPDGYFTASLPPGKYFLSGTLLEVIPVQVLYLGTIRAYYHTEKYERRKAPDKLKTIGPLDSNLEVAQKLMTLGIGSLVESYSAKKIGEIKHFDKVEVRSEYEEAKNIFSGLYPNIQITERLAEPTARPENLRQEK